MAKLLNKFFTLFTILASTACSADDAFSIRTGFGPTTATKSALFSMAYESTFYDHFLYKLDAGFWTDTQPAHVGAPFMSVLGAYRFGDYNGFNVTPAFGFLIMGDPDALLGSPFNFTEELMFGYKTVGIGWKHVSNGGLASPNMGRDYIFLNLTFPLNF